MMIREVCGVWLLYSHLGRAGNWYIIVQLGREVSSVFIMEGREIRFLVATDVHLGHKEKHPVRKDDSFDAFQELLQKAKQQDVDFLLLGGDLFDEVNPSK